MSDVVSYHVPHPCDGYRETHQWRIAGGDCFVQRCSRCGLFRARRGDVVEYSYPSGTVISRGVDPWVPRCRGRW